jgi:hypothetical protein
MYTTDDDEIIAPVKVGAVLRGNDGRRFVIKSIRKANPDDGEEPNMMYTTDDDGEITDITKLEQQVAGLEKMLNDAVGKQADEAVEDADADDGEPTVAALQSEVADLGKTLTAAIATANESAAAADTFDRVADDIAKRDGCSRLVALQKARLEAPDQFRQYQMAGVEIAKAGSAQDRIAGPSAFDNLVRAIRARDKKLTGTAAMAKARAADPEAFKAYQAGA